MQRILTKNIHIIVKCFNHKCDETREMTIQELRDFGELICPKCGYALTMEESLIKN